MLRSRWMTPVVCVLLSLVFPRSAYLDGIEIPNGDFGAGSTLPPLHWQMEDPPGREGILDSSLYHGGTPSLSGSGSGDVSYSQCIDTSTWSGRVEIGGWVYMPGGYNDGDGFISFTWYDEATCSGTGQPVTLSEAALGPSWWTRLSGEIDLPDLPRSTLVSMKVVVYVVGGAEVYFDDIYAQAVPTVVSIDGIAAHSGGWTLAVLGLGVAGMTVYGAWRRRG